MALSNLALFGGAFFTPVLVGKITHTIGWEWSFYLVAIFAGALLPLIFFFVPETAFDRPINPYLEAVENGTSNRPMEEDQHFPTTTTSTTTTNLSSDKSRPDPSNPTSFEKHDYDTKTDTTPPSSTLPPPKVTFAQSLLPFNGRKSNANFFKLALRPFPLFFHPAVLWACLIQGTLIGWTVMIGVVLAAIFLGPPLWFSEVETGYMVRTYTPLSLSVMKRPKKLTPWIFFLPKQYTGPFVGAVIGFIISGLLADWSTKFMIKRNKGVYEPEFRIVLVAAQLVFGCVGLYGFGITAQDVGRYGWFVPDMFFAFEVAGMVMGAVSSALYIVDAHRTFSFPSPKKLSFSTHGARGSNKGLKTDQTLK